MDASQEHCQARGRQRCPGHLRWQAAVSLRCLGLQKQFSEPGVQLETRVPDTTCSHRGRRSPAPSGSGSAAPEAAVPDVNLEPRARAASSLRCRQQRALCSAPSLLTVAPLAGLLAWVHLAWHSLLLLWKKKRKHPNSLSSSSIRRPLLSLSTPSSLLFPPPSDSLSFLLPTLPPPGSGGLRYYRYRQHTCPSCCHLTLLVPPGLRELASFL